MVGETEQGGVIGNGDVGHQNAAAKLPVLVYCDRNQDLGALHGYLRVQRYVAFDHGDKRLGRGALSRRIQIHGIDVFLDCGKRDIQRRRARDALDGDGIVLVVADCDFLRFRDVAGGDVKTATKQGISRPQINLIGQRTVFRLDVRAIDIITECNLIELGGVVRVELLCELLNVDVGHFVALNTRKPHEVIVVVSDVRGVHRRKLKGHSRGDFGVDECPDGNLGRGQRFLFGQIRDADGGAERLQAFRGVEIIREVGIQKDGTQARGNVLKALLGAITEKPTLWRDILDVNALIQQRSVRLRGVVNLGGHREVGAVCIELFSRIVLVLKLILEEFHLSTADVYGLECLGGRRLLDVVVIIDVVGLRRGAKDKAIS